MGGLWMRRRILWAIFPMLFPLVLYTSLEAGKQVTRVDIQHQDLRFDAPIKNLNTSLEAGKQVTRVDIQHQDLRFDAPMKNLTRTSNGNGTHDQIAWIDDEAKDDESFSACILWSDDNFRLEEWLAYHYYLLKLRYVVIAVDNWSKTSVDAIVDRWNDAENKYNLNMTIKVWRDRDYIVGYRKRIGKINKTRNLENATAEEKLQAYTTARTKYYLYKQPQFYKACSIHLIQQNKSWTSYHDTDEFLTFDAKKGKNTALHAEKMQQPGYVLHRLNEIKAKTPSDSQDKQNGLSCLVVRRRRFCSNELSTEETNDLFLPSLKSNSTTTGIIPEGFMTNDGANISDKERQSIVRRFDTLRYKYLTPGDDGKRKSFIDLSQKNPQLYTQGKYDIDRKGKKTEQTSGPFRVHKVMAAMCQLEENKRSKEIKKLLSKENFVIGHYLGSFESYSFRDDARKGNIRSYETWKRRSNQTKGEYSHVPRPWLKGFVKLVGGPKVASYLLQDAARFPSDYDINSKIKEYRKLEKPEKNATKE